MYTRLRGLIAPLIFLLIASFGMAQRDIVVGADSNGEHYDPQRGLSGSAHIMMAMFDSLTRLDPAGNLQPSLAESWELIDNHTWRFKIREGVTFHNGEELNAEVVKLNIDRLVTPHQTRASVGSSVTGAAVVDAYTIDIFTVDVDPLLPSKATNFLIGAPSLVQDPDNDSTAFNKHPIGTGPFKFVKDVPGEYIRLEPYADHWNGAPAATSLTFRIIPDRSVQLAELISGGVDFIENVTPELIDLVNSSGRAHVVISDSTISHTIPFRLDVESPLQDVRVRQAINYAVDLDSIIANVLSGYATPIATVVLPGVLGYNPEVTRYEYNPAKARELLAEAGYADGVTIEFDFSPAIGELYNTEVIQAIARQLSEAGIKLNLNSLEYGIAIQRVYGDRTVNPAFRWQWKIWYNDPDSILYGFYSIGGSAAFVGDQEIQDMLHKARYNMDNAERAQIYSDLQVKFREQALQLPLYNLKYIYGVSDRLEWEPRVDGRLYFGQTTFVD
ncbi:MAG TPA: ABC transporter substrate-binding protein [Trueperaceae bacterium]|nr:ABC transporter substrate-binding protein [Trueperaceae bacterium]